MKSGKNLFDRSSDEYSELMQYDMSFYPEWEGDDDLQYDSETGWTEPANDTAMAEPVGPTACTELKHVSLMRPADCLREGMFSSGKIHLRVKTGKCREGQYCAMVYMSTGILVASETRVIGRKQVERNELRFCPYSASIWSEDDYFVVFLYENEPFALSEFRYEGKNLNTLPVRSLGPDDWEYQLVKYWDGPLNESGENKPIWVPVLCGSADEIRQLMAASPVLAKAFREEDYYVMHEETMAEWLCTFQRVLSETSFVLSAAAEHRLVMQVRDHWNVVKKWDRHDIRCFIREYLSERFRCRLQAMVLSNPIDASDMDGSLLTTLRPADICLSDYNPEEQSDDIACMQEYEVSMRELHALVGLSSLKTELDDMLTVTRFEAARQRLGVCGSFHMLHHMLFTGNPGTGKTTVARLIGKIFKSLGLLSKGEVIETDRRQLVGPYIGRTEEKMTELLKQAKGNVLFIDEAYTLCDTKEDRKDFGNHVIESLLPVMADPQSDILVIFAGYEDEMERLMEINQGLRGRFGHHFHFDDYNADELVEIARSYLEGKSFQLLPEAEKRLKDTVSRFLMQKSRTFSNARWIINFVTAGILPVMARRIMNGGIMDKADLFRNIVEADVSEAVLKLKLFNQTSEQKTLRKRIGFIA